jgi:predicted HicB family RNase H-like nuclease
LKTTTRKDNRKMRDLEVIMVRMPAELKAAVEARAAQEELSMNQLVKRAIRLYLFAGKENR